MADPDQHRWRVGDAGVVVFGPGGPAGMVFASMLEELQKGDGGAEPRAVMGVSIGALFAAIVALRLPMRVLDHGLTVIHDAAPDDDGGSFATDILRTGVGRAIAGTILRNSIVETLRMGGAETLTLAGAYAATGIDLRVLVMRTDTRTSHMLDRHSFGHVLVVDAVLASMSVPGVFPAVRGWADGAFADDYTPDSLREMALLCADTSARAFVFPLIASDAPMRTDVSMWKNGPRELVVARVEIPSREAGGAVRMPSRERAERMLASGVLAAGAVRRISLRF
jgi:predicted acylesterase/phospholipase RssA